MSPILRAIALAAALAGCGEERAVVEEPKSAAAGTEFAETGAPFRFQVPEGWRVQRGAAAGEMDALVVVVPRDSAGPGAAVQVTASRRIPAGSSADLEAALDGVARGIRTQGATTYTPRGRRDVLVGGYRGREEAAEFSDARGQTLSTRTAVFTDGFRVYSISLVAPPEGITAHGRQFDAILSSFQTTG